MFSNTLSLIISPIWWEPVPSSLSLVSLFSLVLFSNLDGPSPVLSWPPWGGILLGDFSYGNMVSIITIYCSSISYCCWARFSWFLDFWSRLLTLSPFILIEAPRDWEELLVSNEAYAEHSSWSVSPSCDWLLGGKFDCLYYFHLVLDRAFQRSLLFQ